MEEKCHSKTMTRIRVWGKLYQKSCVKQLLAVHELPSIYDLIPQGITFPLLATRYVTCECKKRVHKDALLWYNQSDFSLACERLNYFIRLFCFHHVG